MRSHSPRPVSVPLHGTRPVCPRHPRSRVWLDGTYGRGPRRRQRYRCVPGNGERPHKFTEPLPRMLTEEHECWECDRALARHEGPATPRGFEYAVREIADALILLGRGETYRGTGRIVRSHARRTGGRRRGFDGSNIADWVELFAPPVFEAFRPREWPQIVALDDLPFHVSGQALNARGHPIQGGSPSFHVFGAMGYVPFSYGEVKLVGLQAFPDYGLRQGRPYWIEFLDSLNEQLAGKPEQIVCDGDPEIEAAVRAVWPIDAPLVFRCHYHLKHRLLEILRQAQLEAEDPLYLGAANAFKDSGHWLSFERLAQERLEAETGPIRSRRLYQLRGWLRHNADRAAWQLAHRAGRVTDTTAIDQYLAVLRGKLALRRGTFGNRERLNRLLMLMMLEQRDPARRNDYAHVIREQLIANGGRAGRRRQIDDRHGTSSLRVHNPRPRRNAAPDSAPLQPVEPEEEIPF